MHLETLPFHCIDNASGKSILWVHSFIHLSIHSRILLLVEIKSTVLLFVISRIITNQLSQLIIFMIFGSPVKLYPSFCPSKTSCTIIWDTIWVYNKLVSVNTRNKWVGIKYFRSNRILYNCRNRKAKINIFWNRFYPVFIKDRRTVYQFSCLVAESNMVEIFKTFFVLFWRFIFEMFGLEWVQCCLVLP